MQKFLSIFEKLIFWLVLFLFIFIPLYPKFPLINVKGTFVAIRLEDLLIALTISFWMIHFILARRFKNFFQDNLTSALLLFFFIGLLSVFSAIFLTHTVVWHLSFFHYLRRIEFMLLLPVVATTLKTKKQLIWILSTISIVVFIVDIYALGQQYLDWPVISTTNSEFSKGLILRLAPGARVNSTFAGHYDLAVFLAMALIIISSLFFVTRKIVYKIWFIIIGTLSLIVLIMTAARLSFVAAAIGILLTLFLIGKKKFILFAIFLMCLILLYPSQLRDRLISTVTVNLFHEGQRFIAQNNDQRVRSQLNIPTLAVKTSSNSATSSTFASSSGQIASDITPGEPIDSTQLGVYRSFEIRLNLEWPKALIAFAKNPFLGTGYSSIDIATDNDFLRSLGEVGLLGTAAFILVLVDILKKIFRFVKEQNQFLKFFSASTFSMVFAILINGLFIDVFEASKVASLFWMMLGLNLAIRNF